MPTQVLTHKVLLPELSLKLIHWRKGNAQLHLFTEKHCDFEVCPRCAKPSSSVYDHRQICVKDSPLRNKQIALHIRKRRFWCKHCRKPFTEPIKGIKKGSRCTERYKKSLLWACEKFADLKQVRKTYRCSTGYLYKTLYEQLERNRRTRLYPWPKTIGIDEHFFKRNKKLGTREFASIVVDHKNKRVLELVQGKSVAELEAALAYIPGRQNVRFVTLDLCDPFKKFAKSFFQNATLVADKFHVLRLLNPAINRYRKEITGDKRSLKIRRLLLTSGKKLHPIERFVVRKWLQQYPQLQELYQFKEALHGFYRIRGQKKASKALTDLTDRMAKSDIIEVQRLRRTLMKWRNEILAYFSTRLTNGRVEGFNNKAKLVKKRAYGYRSFKNYRLRLLNACA